MRYAQYYRKDRSIRVVDNRCDICNDRLDCPDDIESQIDVLDEIDNSYESEADRTTYYDGPKLLPMPLTTNHITAAR